MYNILWYSGCVIICLIVIIYIIAYFGVDSNNSNTNVSYNITIPSTITHSHIGLRGDMGNQMFQLATLYATARKSQAKMVLPPQLQTLPLYQLCNLNHYDRADLNPDHIFHEFSNMEDINVPADGRNYDIRGYRQCYQYFDNYADDIRQLLKPKEKILNQVSQHLPCTYIALHIRKGDYVKLMHKIPLFREFRQCQLAYYINAIKKIREYYPIAPIVVCTDSVDWVTPIMSQLDSNCMLAPTIDNISPKFSDFCTLYLANAVIISNSTYSWMAAYLNHDKNRPVICPTPWWDPDGFIGKSMALDGPYLHYPPWWLLDTDNGAIIREPQSNIGNRCDNQNETLNIYRFIRGCIV